MKATVLSKASGIGPPRAVAMTRYCHLAIWAVLIFALVPSSILFSKGILDFEKRVHVKERGTATTGTIKRAYAATGNHDSHSYYLDYAYRLKETSLGASAELHGTDAISLVEYQSHKVGDSIPIAYDKEVPETSFTNFHNSAFESHTGQLLNTAIIVTGFLLPIYLIALALFLFAYLKERRLLAWGQMAAGSVIGEEEYYAGRAGRCSRIVYRFTDNRGRVVDGKRDQLPTSQKTDARSRRLRSRVFDHTTVFFDLQDSTKSVVYPPIWARLREPPN